MEESYRRDEFRRHLTMGLITTLEKIPGIQDATLLDNVPSDIIAITSWEQRYSTVLPNEIKDFYLATDGFKLTWKFRCAGQTLSIGNMNINRISDLRRIAGLRHSFDTEHPTLLDLEVTPKRDKPNDNEEDENGERPPVKASDPDVIKPQFGLRWKMFELDSCDGNGRVVLVFPPKPDPTSFDQSSPSVSIHIDIVPTPTPQVWFLDRAFEWHFLSPNFKTYFRMMLVHLGLPQWQSLFTPIGPTPWARQIINLIAPQLLQQKGLHNQDEEEEIFLTNGHYYKVPNSVLDPAIFRTKSKGQSKRHDENGS